MKVMILIEGAQAKGGGSNASKRFARQAFITLLRKSGLRKSAFSLEVYGGRGEVWNEFRPRHRNSDGQQFVCMLIDSESRIGDIDRPWQHLKDMENWDQPRETTEEQVLLMVTSMETWCAADRPTLRRFFGQHLQESALPDLHDLESKTKEDVQSALSHATRNSPKPYQKGKRSFELIEQLNPDELYKLPSFARAIKILKEKTA